MQPYIKLYIDSLNSENSKKAVIKNLHALFRRITKLKNEVGTALNFDWHNLPLSEYSRLKGALLDEAKSSNYINTLMTILRQVLNWAMIQGDLSGKMFADIKQVIKSVSSNKKRQISKDDDNNDEVDFDWLVGQADNLTNLSNGNSSKSIDAKTVERLIKSIGTTSHRAVRNRAIFMCMSHAGMRREEVSQLRLKDLYFSRNASDSFIKVVGKGAKVRNIPMSTPLYESLFLWASLVVKTSNKRKSSYFFRKLNTIDKTLQSGLSNSGIYQIVRKVGENEGVERLHPHKLRHFFATRLLLNGCDIFEVARLLGHSNVDTTSHYDDRGFDSLQKAISELA